MADLERVSRLLATLIWSHVLYEHEPTVELETPDQQLEREARNVERRKQWDEITEGLLSGRITPGVVVGFDLATPASLTGILAAANQHTD